MKQDSLFVSVAYGDGIGPEIMEAAMFLLKEARIGAFIESVEIGRRYYENGVPHGLSPQTIPLLRRTGLLLKGPHAMPTEEPYLSPQHYLEEHFGVMVRLAPLRAFSPLIPTAYPERDLLIIHGLKALEDDGKLLRLACQLACKHGYRTLYWHGNLLPDPWQDVQRQFPGLRCESISQRLGEKTVTDLHKGVIVTREIEEPLIHALSRSISGANEIGCMARLAPDFGLFEPLHDAKSPANPLGVIRAASLMLLHIGKPEHAALLDNAWLRALEDCICPAGLRLSKPAATVSAMEFARAVADRLGEAPRILSPMQYPSVAVAAEEC